MQKTLFSTILMLCFSFYANAQKKSSQLGFYYLGENTHISTNIQNDPIYKNKFTLAGGGGISYTYGISDYLSIQTGLLYTSHNQKWASQIRVTPDSTRTWKGKKRLDYINLPLLLKYNYKMGKRMKFNIFGGAELSYLLKGSGGLVIYRHNDYSDFFDLPTSSNSYYKPLIVQAVFGCGVDVHLAPNWSLNTALRAEVSALDGANRKATYGSEPYYDFNTDSPQHARNWAVGLLVGVSYHFRNNHLLCPSQKW